VFGGTLGSIHRKLRWRWEGRGRTFRVGGSNPFIVHWYFYSRSETPAPARAGGRSSGDVDGQRAMGDGSTAWCRCK